MPSRLWGRGVLFATICLVFFGASIWAQSSSSATQKPADTDRDDPERQQAFQFFEQHKMPEAVPLLEKVVAKYPKDMIAHEHLGVALLSRASTQTEPEKGRADRIQARNELLRAKELGDNSDLCNTLLEGIPEDGSDNSFSDGSGASAAMKRGQSAFGKANWDEAIQEYSRALELDPKNYLAAVFIGDTYFNQKQMEKAGEWFSAAIKIQPNQETAYRYWGDALMAQGKMKEARSKFIEALVAYPYQRNPWDGLHGWLTRNHLKFKEIPIQLPAGPTVDDKGNTRISIDPSALGSKNDSAGAAWLTYPIERSLWRNEKFAKEYPQEKAYRHSLKEEVSALSLTVKVFREQQEKKKEKNPDPGLTLLAQFETEGLLEPYILLMKADKDIAQDYPGYRADHREKLMEFVDKYLVPPAP